MERVSKAVLGLEALALAYPTFLGLVLSIGAIAPFATGGLNAEHAAGAAAGMLIVGGLVSGWYLVLRFFTKGHTSTRTATTWWATAIAAAAASVIVAGLYWVANISATHGGAYFMPVGAGFGILGYGVLFVPSFLHLALEVWGRAV